MKTHEAKKLLKAEMARIEATADRLTAKSVSFEDLARGRCVFVKIHGWLGNYDQWDALARYARTNGFRIE